jgi:glutamate:Na+ symporter, ESS family
MKLELVGTTAFTVLVLFIGYRVRALVPPLDRLAIPAPVIGGLLVAIALAVMKAYGLPVVEFDTTLQQPLMIAFFTSLGFAASVQLLRAGGTQVFILLAMASGLAIVQNLVGTAIALIYGLDPLFGVLTGSMSLTGGPATSLAFAPLIEQAGVANAAPIGLASAMGGILLGSLFGAPIAIYLIRRHRLDASRAHSRSPTLTIAPDSSAESDSHDEGMNTYVALKCLAVVLLAMWAGGAVSSWIERMGVTMPAYIGAMLVAGALRNLDDLTGWLRLPHRSIDMFGIIALAIFLVMALMNLNLLTLSSVAQPLLVTLFAQLAIVALVCVWLVHRAVGKDYDAAVMSGGFAGFMLGTTANAMAVMRSVVERYGVAPRAFLVAPLVGAFFLDFTNALIITFFINLLD